MLRFLYTVFQFYLEVVVGKLQMEMASLVSF